MLTVVTGFSADGYALYGKKFIETFHRHTSQGVGLLAYSPEPIPMPRGQCVLHPRDAQVFAEQNRHIPAHNGLEPTAAWRKKDIRAGYSYRHDAVRFCWQLFYPEDAARRLPDGCLMCWFDADVIFFSDFDESYIGASLNNADLCYLGRPHHTELGFWAVKLSPVTRRFLTALADTYRSGEVFKLYEWHSAYVFDHCRASFPGRQLNLTPGEQRGNVWEKTPLAEFSMHLKGALKEKYIEKFDKAEAKRIRREQAGPW